MSTSSDGLGPSEEQSGDSRERVSRGRFLKAAVGVGVFAPVLLRADPAAAAGASPAYTDAPNSFTAAPQKVSPASALGAVSIEQEGTDGIQSTTPSAWYGTNPPMRLRVSRASPDPQGGQHFTIHPYEHGMALEYAGVLECWVSEFSVHKKEGGQNKGAVLWVGDDTDTGGVYMKARDFGGGSSYSEIASQTFVGGNHGPLRLRATGAGQAVWILAGPEAAAQVQLRLGDVGPGRTPGMTFGPQWDTNLYRSGPAALTTDGQLRATGGLATKVKAGAVSDADFAAPPPNGTLVVDSSGSRIWARVGGAWKSAVLA